MGESSCFFPPFRIGCASDYHETNDSVALIGVLGASGACTHSPSPLQVSKLIFFILRYLLTSHRKTCPPNAYNVLLLSLVCNRSDSWDVHESRRMGVSDAMDVVGDVAYYRVVWILGTGASLFILT